MTDVVIVNGSESIEVGGGNQTIAVLGEVGPKGDKGDQGIQGIPGPQGVQGPAATVTVGTVTTGAAGSSSTVVNSGTSSSATFDFTIPRGATGAAGTVAVGTVTTGAAGSSVAITNSGTASAAVLNFTIPRGDTGATPVIADATTSVSGLMSATDKTKLNGIATGATANSTDATLLARANHTGTQLVTTISNLGSGTVTPTGGTTARSLSARFADVLNVKDFGATGDGTTNDTTAIQAAVDAGAGRTLYFPPGTYRTSRIQIGSGDARQLTGVPGQSILKTIDTDIAAVQLLSTSGVTDVDIDGLTFDGNSATLTNFQTVVLIFNSQRIRFRRCVFQNTRGITLLLSSNIQNCTIEQCRFLNCGATSGVNGANRKQALAFVGATGGGTDSYGNQVINNTFETVGLDCIAWQDQNYGVVTGNRCNVTGAAGVYCWASRHSVISNNIVRSGPGGASPFSNGIDCPASSNITIIGNLCYENSADGIGVYNGSTNCTIVGNTCLNNDQDSSAVKRAGIFIMGSGHSIAGNVCTDTQATKTQDYGILIDTAATNITVDSSNNLIGNATAEVGYVNRASNLNVVTSTTSLNLALRSYTVAALPSASTAAQMIYVSDGAGSKRIAYSDGTNWRWVSTDGVVS